MKAIPRVINKTCTILNICGSLWIGGLMLLIVADVLGRVLFNHPVTGTPEIVKNSITSIVFLQLAYSMFEERHVRSTILLSKVHQRTRIVLEILDNIVGLAVFLGIIISSWHMTLVAWAKLEYEGEGALRVPTYPVRTIIILGSLLMCWQCLQHVFVKIVSMIRATKEVDECRQGVNN